MKVSRRAAAIPLLVMVMTSAVEAKAAPKKQCIASAEAGQQLRGQGKLLAARKAFGVCTATDCPAIVRRDCGRWVDELEATIPSVIVKLEGDDGNEVMDGRVEIDGEESPVGPGGRATPLDPGPHKFVWVRDGGNVEQETVIREGERNRTLILRAPSAKAIGPMPPPEGAGREKPTPSVLPWVLVGVGAGLGGTGAVLWGIGLNERANLVASCASAHACVQTDVSSSRTKLIVGDVLVGVGVVALAGALYFFLTKDTPPATTGSAAR
jgi:hypothetical protein